jgi:SAM-dependent methyltransferase
MHHARRMTHHLGALLLLLSCSGCGASSPPAGAPHDHPHDHPHGHGPLVHRFEKAEDWAREFDDPARDVWQRPAEVIAALRLAEGMTVVDLGAGTGYFLPHLSRAVGAGGKVLALDVEPDMVRYLRERAAREHLANVEPRLVPFDDPRLSPGSADRVLIVDTWHHIDSRAAYTARLRDALRPGGLVVIVDFTLASAKGPPPQHRLAPDRVVAELAAGGLDAHVVESRLPDQYVVVGARR